MEADRIEIVEKAETRDGVAFHLVVSPAVSKSPARAMHSAHNTPATLCDITEKLKFAEQRRKSMEVEKLDDLAKRMRKIVEVQAAKQDLESQFKERAAEEHERKQSANKENKEARVQEMLTRLKMHDERILKVRGQAEQALEQMIEKKKESMEEKLQAADKRREENLKEMIVKLKEHDEHVEEVRKGLQSDKQETGDKMRQSMARREEQLENMQDKIRGHIDHCKYVKGSENME